MTSTFPVKASEIQPIDSTNIIEVFDDGSYIESFTEENIIITLFLVVHPQNLLEEHIPINHLVEKFYGQLLLLELLHITDHPQAVLKPSVSTTCPSSTFKLASKSATKHNSTATATASFKQYNDSVYLRTITRSVSISCDKSGKLK